MLPFRIILALSFCCGLELLSCVAYIAETKAGQGVSGTYASLLIGVDEKSHVVTGFYENTTGWDERLQIPRFVCRFFLTGKLIGNTASITTWQPGAQDVIPGQLAFRVHEGKPWVRIKLNEEHGGCWNVEHFADADEAEAPLEKRGDWTAIRVVSAKRAYFHASADAKTKRKAYVIAGDVLRVFQHQDGWQIGWLDAEYGTERITRGWIREADVLPSLPTVR